MDDSRNSLTVGAGGELAMIGAQRHTSLTDPVTSSVVAWIGAEMEFAPFHATMLHTGAEQWMR